MVFYEIDYTLPINKTTFTVKFSPVQAVGDIVNNLVYNYNGTSVFPIQRGDKLV